MPRRHDLPGDDLHQDRPLRPSTRRRSAGRDAPQSRTAREAAQYSKFALLAVAVVTALVTAVITAGATILIIRSSGVPDGNVAKDDAGATSRQSPARQVQPRRSRQDAAHETHDSQDSHDSHAGGWRRGEPTLGIMAIFRNEAIWMTEWLIHYAEEGVTQFVLLNQNSADNGPALAKAVAQRRSDLDIQVYDDVKAGEQELNYGRYIQFVKTDWLLIVDLDEMMYARMGYNTLTQYLAALPNHVSLVAVAWKLFGSSGHGSHPVSGAQGFSFRKKILERVDLFHQKWRELQAVEIKCLVRLATLRSHLGLGPGEPITPSRLPFGRVETHQVIPLSQVPEPEFLKAMYQKPPFDRVDWPSSTGTVMQMYLPDGTNATTHQPIDTISMQGTSRIIHGALDGKKAFYAAQNYLSRKKMDMDSMSRPIAKLLINSTMVEGWPVHLNHYRTGSCEYWHRIKKDNGIVSDAAFVRSRTWKMFREMDARAEEIFDDELAQKRGRAWPVRARVRKMERLWPDGRPFNTTAIVDQRGCDDSRCPCWFRPHHEGLLARPRVRPG